MNEEIKGLRILLGQTQKEFANTIGVSVGTVRKWEQEVTRPSALAMEKIATIVKKVKRVQGKE